MKRVKIVLPVLLLLATALALDAGSSLGKPVRIQDPRIDRLRAEQAQARARGDEQLAREIEARIQEIYVEHQPQISAEGAVIAGELEQLNSFGFGPDVVIDTGIIWATAGDYEMDGTMWAAYSRRRDSAVVVVKSTDHGNTWAQIQQFWTNPKSLLDRVELIVGQGDSAFVYVFGIHPANNGDLFCVRFKRDGSNFQYFWVVAGPDTINDFIACRDFSASNYWLYVCAGDNDRTFEMDDFLVRSTTFGRTWAVLDTFRWCSDGSYQAGAGSRLYLASRPPFSGRLNLLYNTLWGNPDSWHETFVQPDTFEVMDPVITPSFVTPSESAVVWALYSHNYRNSGDWDMKYVYSTDGGVSWSGSYYLASRTDRYERFGDIKHYTSRGNPYVNASYISEGAGYRYVYRHWVHQAQPTNWSDTLRINTNSAGTGRQIRPRLLYSPGAPGTGAGCLFTGQSLLNLYWNAPWTGTGIESGTRLEPANELRVVPNPMVNGATFFWRGRGEQVAVYDAMGRRVWSKENPASGVNWDRRDGAGNRVSAGVYFVKLYTAQGTTTRALVVQ